MKKRTAAVFLVLCVLFCGVTAGMSETEDDILEESFHSALNSPGSVEGLSASFSVSGYNIPTFSDGDFKYRMSDDGETAVLVSYSGTDADVVFPDTVNGLPVTGIDTAMCLCDPTLESIRIPGSVQTIGIRAFAQCTSLKTVVIDEGVTKLDKSVSADVRSWRRSGFPNRWKSLMTARSLPATGCRRSHSVTDSSPSGTWHF